MKLAHPRNPANVIDAAEDHAQTYRDAGWLPVDDLPEELVDQADQESREEPEVKPDMKEDASDGS